MTDDHGGFDARLRDRLRAAEGRTPGGHPPTDLAGSGSSRTLRLTLLATTTAAAVILAAIVLQLRPTTEVATASPTSTGSPSPYGTMSPSPEASPTATVPPTVTPVQTPAVTPLPTWRPVSQFGADGTWTTVTNIAHGSAGYLAIGHEVPLDEDGHPTGDGRYVMWASADGLSWREVRVPPQVEFADLKDVIAAENGSFVLLATGSAQFPRELRYVLWSSDGDGDWTRVPHDFGGYGPIRKAVRWAEGYAFLEPLSASPARVFMSDTGLEWEEGLYYHGDTYQTRIYDIGGGDEGIVMLGHRTLQSGEQIEIATATSTGNANDWLERRDPFGDEADFATRLTALGPDWIAVRRGDRLVAEFWRSANGLEWTPVARIDLPGMSFGGDTLFTVGGSVYFAQGAEGAIWPSAGEGSTWSSTDGTTWRQVPMAPGAVVTAGTDHAGGTLLAGVSHDGRATFWTAP